MDIFGSHTGYCKSAESFIGLNAYRLSAASTIKLFLPDRNRISPDVLFCRPRRLDTLSKLGLAEAAWVAVDLGVLLRPTHYAIRLSSKSRFPCASHSRLLKPQVASSIMTWSTRSPFPTDAKQPGEPTGVEEKRVDSLAPFADIPTTWPRLRHWQLQVMPPFFNPAQVVRIFFKCSTPNIQLI
ncbi:unnamed protein product [Protopolystoma xenopodis]|uniref:Uncharacterized protein n=1 Tax=Protopolystoma xenopodis TaxID=117903 RepID=A0A448XNE1_9PLAT|nr:unnamed protein product [Protopolystoma xenopodis]